MLRAWPIILANASVPLLGLADTAIMGHSGNTSGVAALAVATLLFNFLFWAFGFLRMSTTGFIAQASTTSDLSSVKLVLLRSLILALLIGVILILSQTLLARLSFLLFNATASVESQAQEYFLIRIFGAPATLGLYCLFGVLIGLGKSKWLLFFQLFLNLNNVLLDLLFAVVFNFGLKGIAVGTLVAEWFTFIVAIFFIFRLILPSCLQELFYALKMILKNFYLFLPLLNTNTNIFIRTLFLLAGFFWFTNESAKLGDHVLAANHILLGIISFSAFFLDAFAFVTEAEVGRLASSSGSRRFRTVIIKTTELAGVAALFLAFLFYLWGSHIITAMTSIEQVQTQAIRFLPFAATYILCSFLAFQLDGIFIGLTLSRAMRNTSVFSFLLFIACNYLLTFVLPIYALWLSFIFYVITRALSLGYYYIKVIDGPGGKLR